MRVDIKILVIEDNPGDYALIEAYLTEEYQFPQTINATSYATSQSILEMDQSFDAVLLDLSLPDKSGESLVYSITQVADKIPVIVLTGYEDREFGIKSLSLGVEDYLLKDELSPSLLAKAIEYSRERKRVKKQIRDSETKYRNLFHLSPSPMWVYDTETLRFLDVNEAAIQHYGYSKEEFLKMSLLDINPKELHSKVIKAAKAIPIDSDKIEANTHIHHTRSNKQIIVELHRRSISFQDKNARLVLVNDVTTKVKQEKLLRETNIQLETAQEIGKIGYWELDLKTDRLFWSDEVYRIMEISKNKVNITFEAFLEMIHPHDREKFEQNRKKAIAGEDRHDIEHRILCPSGKIKYVYQRGGLVRENGNPVKFKGIIQDITEKKEEEARSKLLESVITQAREAVVITEAAPINLPGPKILYVNEAFSQMTGYSMKEVQGKNPRFLQGPDTDRKELDKLRKAMENWQPSEIELINYKKNGEPFWSHLTVAPVADSHGWFTHWISIQRDITSQKQHIQAIEDQNEKLREIAWIQSHVVRAPLARMMGLIELIETDETEENRKEEGAPCLIKLIKDTAYELDEVIRNIAQKADHIKIP